MHPIKAGLKRSNTKMMNILNINHEQGVLKKICPLSAAENIGFALLCASAPPRDA
jgi:hypothetical protein